MWVRAQVDYLQRLPNDREKRSALKELPPDLPQTYIRIFASIHASFPEKTRRYIQRLLKWLVYCERETKYLVYGSFREAEMTFDSLRQIVCIENDRDWPTNEDLPTFDQLHHWLGCLIRLGVTESDKKPRIELSHFTVKEFLTMSSDKVSRPDVQQYLVDPSDWTCLADDCMTYLTHCRFRNIDFSTWDDVETFLSHHPFYRYAAVKIYKHLSSYHTDIEPNSAIQRFFSIPPSKEFTLWLQCSILLVEWPCGIQDEFDVNTVKQGFPLSPLHFAAIAGLKNQIKQTLAYNVIPSVPAQAKSLDIAPLHVAIAISNNKKLYFRDGHLRIPINLHRSDYSEHRPLSVRYQRSLAVTRLLVDSGANINQQLVMNHVPNMTPSLALSRANVAWPKQRNLQVTPLVLSLLCKNLSVANFLLDVGAKCDAVAENNLKEAIDVCSVKNLLELAPGWDSGLNASSSPRDILA